MVSLPPPAPAPTAVTALAAPVDLSIIWNQITHSEIGLPLVMVLVGMGLYAGFMLRPRSPRKRKNDER